LSFATEEISLKLGEALGGLLNATFGNAVELIVRCAQYFPIFRQVLTICRSALWLFVRTRLRLCNLPCSDPFFQTCCWSWECAFCLEVFDTVVRPELVRNGLSQPLLRRLPAPSWPSPLLPWLFPLRYVPPFSHVWSTSFV
jgi:hypothetical protein